MHEDWIRLARKAQEGDLDAFEKLVERFQRPVCAAIHPIVRDWHLTQDVVQEAFAAVFAQLSDIRDPLHFRAYLYRVARNRAVSRVREASGFRERSIESVREEEVRGSPRRPKSFSRRGEPSLSEEDLELVRRTILCLPNEYGTLLVMRYVEGMAIMEIAMALGRSPKAVKAVLYRARLKARSHLRKAGLDLEGILDEV